MGKSALLILLGAALATILPFLAGHTFAEETASEPPAQTVRAFRLDTPVIARWGVECRQVQLYFPETGITFEVNFDRHGKILPGWPGSGTWASYSGKPALLAILEHVPEEQRLRLEPDEVDVPKGLAEKIIKLAEATKGLRALEAKIAGQGAGLAGELQTAGCWAP